MRKQNYKGRCVKRSLSKCRGICKTYDAIQRSYLSYQDMTVLAPICRTTDKTLSKDEKNMRWALNKFFYNQHKHTLTTTYAFMLKEKYSDCLGNLTDHYPTFNQFRYFYQKNLNLQKYYISRNGLKNYQRNNRPLLGNGVQEFAPAVGVGMLDSTVCDIYLVDDAGILIGRPLLTACIDAYSGLCCGSKVHSHRIIPEKNPQNSGLSNQAQTPYRVLDSTDFFSNTHNRSTLERI